jgi:hypothetical protein
MQFARHSEHWLSGTEPSQFLLFRAIIAVCLSLTQFAAEAGGTHSYHCVLCYRTNTIGQDRRREEGCFTSGPIAGPFRK